MKNYSFDFPWYTVPIICVLLACFGTFLILMDGIRENGKLLKELHSEVKEINSTISDIQKSLEDLAE